MCSSESLWFYICISLMTKDAVLISMCLLAIGISFFGKMCVYIFCPLLIALFVFLLLSYEFSIYSRHNPFVRSALNISFKFVVFIFIALSFEEQKFFIVEANLFISFILHTFGVLLKKSLPNPRSLRIPLLSPQKFCSFSSCISVCDAFTSVCIFGEQEGGARTYRGRSTTRGLSSRRHLSCWFVLFSRQGLSLAWESLIS